MFRKKFEKKLFSSVIIISHLTIMPCMVSGCDETKRVFLRKNVIFDEKAWFLLKNNDFDVNNLILTQKVIFCPAERDHHSQEDSFWRKKRIFNDKTIFMSFGNSKMTSKYEQLGYFQLSFVHIWWELDKMMSKTWGTFL